MQESGQAYTIRDHQPGDLGLVIHHQAALYNREYGWDITFEALLAEISAAFIRNFKPEREACWVAEREGVMLGSVMIVEEDEHTAKLRMLFVLEAARGLGIGGALVDRAIAFSKDKGYARMTLWTNDILVAARAIYQKRGFALTHEQPHRSFGQDLVSQTWELALS